MFFIPKVNILKKGTFRSRKLRVVFNMKTPPKIPEDNAGHVTPPKTPEKIETTDCEPETPTTSKPSEPIKVYYFIKNISFKITLF